jgi:hypothetical protein
MRIVYPGYLEVRDPEVCDTRTHTRGQVPGGMSYTHTHAHTRDTWYARYLEVASGYGGYRSYLTYSSIYSFVLNLLVQRRDACA